MSEGPRWEPIKRAGKPEPTKIDERTGRVVLRFPLSSRPPPEWAEDFEDLATQTVAGPSPPPEVREGAVIVYSVSSGREFEGWIGAVDRHINDANSRYQHLLDERERERQETEAAEEKRRQQLEEARRLIEELPDETA